MNEITFEILEDLYQTAQLARLIEDDTWPMETYCRMMESLLPDLTKMNALRYALKASSAPFAASAMR